MTNTLITQDRLDSLTEQLSLTPHGLVAELGTYKGGSLKFMAEAFPERKFFGFDTFSGLPEQDWKSDEIHVPGEFNASMDSVREFINLPNVDLVQGYFPESAWNFDASQFTFIHCDFDFELGIKSCIDFFWKAIPSGSVIVWDDYGWPNCPGVAKAIKQAGLPVIKTARYQAASVKP